MQLTGPPRLAGILRPYALAGGPVRDAWEERRDVVRGRTRTRKKGAPELWPTWSFEVLVTERQWLGWRSDLAGDAAGEVDWCPRTRLPEDPTYLPEPVYRVRCASDLPTLEELRLRGSDGRGRYRVAVELEGVRPYAEAPGTVDGGFALVRAVFDFSKPEGEETEGWQVEPYGRDARLDDLGTVRVSLLGEDFDLTAVHFGNALCAAARSEDAEPWDGGHLALDLALAEGLPEPPPRLGPVLVHPLNA